ncbi:MAG: hypothetical protein WAK84_08815 [Candidatus Cybelea sp.]
MLRSAAILVVAALASVAAAARADTPPLRHLVYSFTFESKQNGTVPNDPGTSGAHTYTGNLDDTGTITVDVLREAADRGLVVIVSEQGDRTRTGEATTCAVYGNTNVACDPAKKVNREELSLLRFLGANFVDPFRLDGKQRWSVSEKKPGDTMSADYTIDKSDGDLMAIGETRHVEDTSQGVTTFDAETKIEYVASRLLPTTIDEYATEQRNAGVNGIYTTVYQTTLKLVSDSMAKQ